ncbi:MAG TPA: dihydropteroate synthase [Terriglobales bacterium]|jgi:dihydropteroate synthase|nr:dihydropteroate synthase [Terriglobales bacterium]
MRPRFPWKLRTRELALGERTLVMGVLNVTPDSFSDAGKFLNRDHALGHALEMLEEGADLIDIGGESTRPGARVSPGGGGGVSEEEELRRVLPVIQELRRERPDTLISVDTYKSGVAREAVAAGAEIVNDVSAFRWDPAMAQAVASLGCGAILMHMRGRPEEWRALPPLDDLMGLVTRELAEWAMVAMGSGVERGRIALDPGFGFGKNYDENYSLLARLGEMARLNFPIVVGTSRKSFLGRTLAREGKDLPAEERLYGTLAAVTASVLAGAHIVRVHDVRPAAEAVKIADAVLRAAISP